MPEYGGSDTAEQGCSDTRGIVQILQMQGEWGNHPKFGEQFRVVHYKSLVPATVAGIEKYLGSGLIKGIGPIMAKRIVAKFGERTLEVIED